MNVDLTAYNMLLEKHPSVAKLVLNEYARQMDNVELIASENFPSDDVKIAAATCFMAKYAEGYPTDRATGNKGRYYNGCKYIDSLEQLCCDTWANVFNTDYHVNVQPHSGSGANMAAYQAVLSEGDTILSMDVDEGGHLTHSSGVSFVSKRYNVIKYGVDEKGFIDMAKVQELADMYNPTLILAGASAYSRTLDFKEFRKIADSVGAYLMVDMAHIAGLVAAGEHPSPFGIADIITTTTQKTLRGVRGGLIFCKPELAKKIDSAIFPGTQGGPAENIIAAKLVTAEEALDPSFKSYIKNVVYNCKSMATAFTNKGFNVVTGGTDNHLLLLDLSKTHPDVTGKALANKLDEIGITVNANKVPGDTRSPKICSGIRIGTAAMTTKGWEAADFEKCAETIMNTVNELQAKIEDVNIYLDAHKK